MVCCNMYMHMYVRREGSVAVPLIRYSSGCSAHGSRRGDDVDERRLPLRVT